MKKLIDQKNHQVIEMLELLRPVPDRNAEKTRLGRQQFLAKAQGIRQTVSESTKPRHIGWTNIFKIRKERLAMQILTSVLVIFVMLFGGAGGTVFASQSSMPEDLLYPVKLWSEDVRLNLSGDVNRQLDLLEQFTQRRMLEVQNSLAEGEIPATTVLQRLQDQTRLSLQLAAEMPDEELLPTLLRLHDRLMKQDQIMQQLCQQDQADALMTQTRDQLRNQLRLVEEGLESPLTFRQRLNNPNENVPDNTPGILNPDRTAPAGNAVEKTPGPGNSNGNQFGKPTDSAETLQPTAEPTLGSQNGNQDQGNQNGNQYGDQDGDGICDQENCPNPDCDGECDNINCQGSGDCDGSGKTEEAPGAQNQYQGGKTDQPGQNGTQSTPQSTAQGNKNK